MKKSLILAAGTAATAVAAVAFAAGGPNGSAATLPSPPQEPITQVIDGYELDQSLDAARAFQGNDLIFEAQVLHTGSPRKVVVKGTDLSYIYTPVQVRVTKA